MRHPLSDNYRQGRDRLLDLGRGLSAIQAATTTTACPAWTIKDIYSHLAGISTDILAGNTSEAATEAWADGHVADRLDRALPDVLDEWHKSGSEVSKVMESVGEAFPLELFVDQWTHEWDVRAALGPSAAAVPDNTVFDHFLDDFAANIGRDALAAGLDRLSLDVGGRRYELGEGDEVGELCLSTFEFARISMGRRSKVQLAELEWPMVDPSGHIDVIVRWSVAQDDVIDPWLPSAPA